MATSTKPTSLPYLVGTVALALSVASVLVACGDAGAGTLLGTNRGTQSTPGMSPTPVLTGDDDSDAGAANVAVDAAPPESQGEQLFRALQTTLVTTCGGADGACHVSGAFLNGTTPVWLAQPDPYLSAKKYPGIITADPYASKLVIKGPHEGPGFTGPNAALGAQVLAWLTEEATEMVAVQLPSTAVFAVQPGPNVVDISPGGTGITGAKISFVANANLQGILTLTNLAVQAPTTSGLHIAHPIFAIVPPTGPVAPDPVDSLSNVDQTVAPAESIALGTGTLILESFASGSELKIEFNTLSAVAMTLGDGGVNTTGGGCKDVPGFTANAVPAIQANQCLNCHGTTGGSGYSSLDLTKVGIDDTAACAQALTKVNLTNKSQSDIILAPTGGIANHPFQNASATYATMMLTWINNE